jgi:hypothetical protein
MRRKPKSFASLLIFITRAGSIHTAHNARDFVLREKYIHVCAAWHQRHPAPKEPDQPFNASLFSRRANLFVRRGEREEA